MRLAHPDWLHHTLSVAGPVTGLVAFRDAAAGSGVVPWQLETDRMEEDWFHRLLGAGTLSQHGAETLARQLRDAVADRHQAALDPVAAGRFCPFDLHALVPVPERVLLLGPDHPEAVAWLWAEWGTTEPLRRVTVAEAEGALRFGFWSADWTPWRALARIGDDWPALRFDVRPDYAPR